MNYNYDRNWGCRISDEHTIRGLRTLVMENELLRISVLLDKGTDIYEFLYKPHDVDFMWRGPQQLRDPRMFASTVSRASGNFQDYYHGGWQEVFPNGGAHLKYKGAELGQHGEVSIIPWECRIETDREDEVAARMWTRTYRTPFYIEKTLRLKAGVAALFIEERIVNEGCEDMDYMWGHHPTFGHPFLDSSCRIDIPATRVEVQSPLFCENSMLPPGAAFDRWPIVKDRDGNDFDLSAVPPPEAKTSEMCYLLGLDDGWYGLTNANRKIGFGMRWDKEIFPVVWLWEVFRGNFGYPWYGRTYNLALEPWSSHPGGMANALERKTTRRLGPGESLETSLLACAYDGLSQVSKINADGSVEGK
ncbi:MAG: aldose 1-epimerase [bacterium]